MASTCDTCGNGSHFGAQMMGPTMIGAAPMPYQPAPYMSASVPTMPAITVPSYQSTGARSIYPTSVTPIPNSYEETVPARGVPTPRDEAANQPRKTSMFQGVPSAAAAWQRQSAYAR